MTLPGGRNRISLRVSEARDLAMNLLAAAEAAMGDAFIMEFMRDAADAQDDIRLLLAFRVFRNKYEFPEDTL